MRKRLGPSQVDLLEARAERCLRAALARVRAFAQHYRRRIVVLAGAIFAVGLVLGIDSLSMSWRDARAFPLVLIASAGVPASVALKSLEFRLCASSVGRRLGFWRGVAVTSVATVSNLLPVPGALAIRGAAMVDAGASLRETGGILLLASGLWMAMAVAVMGAALLPAQHAAAWLLLLGGGLGAVFIAGWIGGRSTKAVALGFVGVRAGLLGVMVLRIWLAFWAIGASIPPIEAAYYVLAGIVGSIVTIVPAGLGISEGAAALVALATGGVPAAAFVALALNRIVGIAVNGLVVLAAGVVGGRGASG